MQPSDVFLDGITGFLNQGVSEYGEIGHEELRQSLYHIDGVSDVGGVLQDEIVTFSQIPMTMFDEELSILAHIFYPFLAVVEGRAFSYKPKFVDRKIELPKWIEGYRFVPIDLLEQALKFEYLQNLSDYERKAIRDSGVKTIGRVLFGAFD